VANEAMVNEFKSNLNIIRNAEENTSHVFVDDYRNALIFLESVTQIITKADFDHSIGYKSKADYISDMAAWEQWLKKSKCKLTRQYVDSAIARKQYKPK
jgi:UDP-N-acetylmuramate-alanine ligase